MINHLVVSSLNILTIDDVVGQVVDVLDGLIVVGVVDGVNVVLVDIVMNSGSEVLKISWGCVQ